MNVSSFAAHANPLPLQGAYGASKAALSSLFQHLAEEIPAEKVQIVSFHPGAIFTPGARRNAGLDETSLPWDDGMCTIWLYPEELFV
jgi:NAD(P)-dependent dehydrogenase (short-subunit alcohol dehydrogenase family)